MAHMRHEIRKLELENEKLRQTLKQKLNLKGSHQHQNIATKTSSSVSP